MKGVLETEYGHCNYCVCDNENCSMIYNLFVEEKYRRKGHARTFIQQSISHIRETGYKGDISVVAEPEMNSISKEELVRFYERMKLKVIN